MAYTYKPHSVVRVMHCIAHCYHISGKRGEIRVFQSPLKFPGDFNFLISPFRGSDLATMPWKSSRQNRVLTSIAVELSGGTARSRSSCTIESPAQSSQRPSVAQTAARAGAGFDLDKVVPIRPPCSLILCLVL